MEAVDVEWQKRRSLSESSHYHKPKCEASTDTSQVFPTVITRAPSFHKFVSSDIHPLETGPALCATTMAFGVLSCDLATRSDAEHAHQPIEASLHDDQKSRAFFFATISSLRARLSRLFAHR